MLGEEEFRMMKDGVGVINLSRGGALNEVALIEAIDHGKVAFAGLDVFENEPNPATTSADAPPNFAHAPYRCSYQ